MTLIPDPAKPHGSAIDTETGQLAPAVHFIPPAAFADPGNPTMAELEAATTDGAFHIGWATGITPLGYDVESVEIPQDPS